MSDPDEPTTRVPRWYRTEDGEIPEEQMPEYLRNKLIERYYREQARRATNR